MVKITSKEAKKLRELGVNDKENGISTGSSTHKKSHYLCESKNNMALLNQIRGIK